MAVTVVTPPSATDLTTLSSVKAALGITDGASDATLSALITSVSGEIEDYCQRVFGLREITETVNYTSRTANRNLRLREWPIVSVTELKYDGVTIDPSEYSLQEPNIGFIFAKNGWNYTGQEFLYEITYQHGYVLPSMAGTRNFPFDLEKAVISAVASQFNLIGRDNTIESEAVPGVYSVKYGSSAGGGIGSANGGSGAFPADVIDVLNRYRRTFI